MVKPTFVSKLRQYVNIFSPFTIFSGKNNQNPKDFIKNNFFFKLRRNYAGDKKFSLSLRKLDGTPAKFFSNQDLTQLSTLNHIFLDIGNSPACDDFVIKYSPKKYFYRFRLLTVTLSTKILNVDDGDIIVGCVGLHDCKKADVNGKRTSVLGIIHTKNFGIS